MTKRRKHIITAAIAVLCMVGIIAIAILITQHQKSALSNLPASFERQWALRNRGQAIEGSKGRSKVDESLGHHKRHAGSARRHSGYRDPD